MSTRLYILRHAIAEERDAARYPDDALRPLTDRGAKKMREIAGGMRAMGLDFTVILSSPFLRARQTADIVAREFKARDRLALSVHLEPGGDPARVLREVESASKSAPSILLVGHEPALSALISTLLAGHDAASVTLKKGGLCSLSLSFTPGSIHATLEWLLTPWQLRQMVP